MSVLDLSQSEHQGVRELEGSPCETMAEDLATAAENRNSRLSQDVSLKDQQVMMPLILCIEIEQTQFASHGRRIEGWPLLHGTCRGMTIDMTPILMYLMIGPTCVGQRWP